MSLAAPAPEVFESRQALIASTQSWASHHGYAIVITQSKAGKVYLGCDRGGAYRNRMHLTDATRRRRTGSRLIGCPFSLVGVSLNGTWHLYVRDEQQNHAASTTTSQHPTLQRLSPMQRAEIRELSQAGVAPRAITAFLRREDAGSPVLVRDVYNARTQMQVESLAGRTPIHELMAQLDADQLHTATKLNVDGHLTHLFFAFQDAVKLYNVYPEVLLPDCTYKTNRFNMPLLNVIGITGLGTSFYLSYTFLQAE